jgi:type I restriction enzyme S subunit
MTKGIETRRLRFLFDTKSGATPPSGVEQYWDGDINWVTPEDLGKLEGRYIEETRRRISEDGYKNCGVSLAPANSLVLSKRAPIGQVAILSVDATCNQGCFLLTKQNGIDERLYYYVLRYLRPLIEILGRGSTFMELSADDLRSVRLPFPDKETQRLIADYLDRETARIDALVAEKGKMLALLEEKRAALISRAVTRGLDPTAPLKPSGQEWLGAIPAHWPTTKFSWDVFISEGQVDPEDDRFSEMVLIAPNHIESSTGQVTYKETSADQGAISGKYLCRKGDVLYSKIRPALRKVALADEDCLCSADMYALRPSEKLMPEYLQYFLLSEDFSTWAKLESARVAMPKINRETLSAIRIPVPPLQEQERLVSEIRKGTERIDLQRKAIRGSIELLKERRAALITSAVTGQIPAEEMQL